MSLEEPFDQEIHVAFYAFRFKVKVI